MSLSIPRLSYQKIGQIADNFLQEYHPNLNLPIPIEEIAESKLNLKIIEEMNLKKDYDIDGFLTSDLTRIFIDFDLYMKFENRTRLTIAHEVGHLILHGQLFQDLKINSIEDLNSLAEKMTDDHQSWFVSKWEDLEDVGFFPYISFLYNTSNDYGQFTPGKTLRDKRETNILARQKALAIIDEINARLVKIGINIVDLKSNLFYNPQTDKFFLLDITTSEPKIGIGQPNQPLMK